jgi:hypothetical protein
MSFSATIVLLLLFLYAGVYSGIIPREKLTELTSLISQASIIPVQNNLFGSSFQCDNASAVAIAQGYLNDSEPEEKGMFLLFSSLAAFREHPAIVFDKLPKDYKTTYKTAPKRLTKIRMVSKDSDTGKIRCQANYEINFTEGSKETSFPVEWTIENTSDGVLTEMQILPKELVNQINH